MKKTSLLTALFLLPALVFAGGGHTVELHKMHAHIDDQASLQRGARLYMNYCSGCHSLKFMRYNRMAKDIGLVDANGDVDTQLVQKNLIFTGDKIFNTVQVAMHADDAHQWFGVTPPDLSLIARVRGVNWLYTYLLGFYADPKRTVGTNNVIFADSAMPNVLLPLQGEQVAVYRTDTITVDGKTSERQVVDHLELRTIGSMDSAEFDTAVQDLVNFLAYVGEPAKLQRQRIGVWVLIFLAVFIGLAFWLKKEFWKDID